MSQDRLTVDGPPEQKVQLGYKCMSGWGLADLNAFGCKQDA